MPHKPKAILFDLDDTLISFRGVSEQAWETCCAEWVSAHDLPVSVTGLLAALRRTRRWYWGDPQRHKVGRENMQVARREIVRCTFQSLGIADEALSRELADRYSAYQHSLVHLFPNTLGVLAKLKRGGYRLGLITNGSAAGQREKIERFALAPYFEIILIDQEVGFSKPDARIFEHARELLGLRYQELWMVGDNLVWDIQSPKALGIYTVWYDAEQAGLPAGAPVVPDTAIRDIAELLPKLM